MPTKIKLPNTGNAKLLWAEQMLTMRKRAAKPTVTVSANITTPTTWTSDNIYNITSNISITDVLTINAGTRVEIDDGVVVTLGLNTGSVPAGEGIEATGATITGTGATDNWKINSGYYGPILDLTNCNVTGGTFENLRIRASNSGRVELDGNTFDRMGGFAGAAEAIDIEAYTTGSNTVGYINNNTFTNTVTSSLLNLMEHQAGAYGGTTAVSNNTFDTSIQIDAESISVTGNVVDGTNCKVGVIEQNCTVQNNWIISRKPGGAYTNDALNVVNGALVKDNIIWGGLHGVATTTGTAVVIRDNVIVANGANTNEQINGVGNSSDIINNLFLLAPSQANIILYEETGVDITDNTFHNSVPRHIYLNHAGTGGVSAQVANVTNNSFTDSTTAALYDEDNVAGGITTIGKNLYIGASGSYKSQINTPGTDTSPVTSPDPSYSAPRTGVSDASFSTSGSASTYRDTLFGDYTPTTDGGDVLGCSTAKVT